MRGRVDLRGKTMWTTSTSLGLGFKLGQNKVSKVGT
jgi:hypothetical protein